MRALFRNLESDSLGKFGMYFFPPIAALVLLGILSFLSLQNIRSSEGITARLHESIAAVKGLTRSLFNAETGARGYLLTNQPDLLEPYHASLSSIPIELAQLRHLTMELQMSRALDELAALIQQRLNQISTAIHLQTEGNSQDAASAVGSKACKETMDRVRDATISLETSLRGKVTDNNATSWAAYSNAISMSAVALILALSASIWSLLRVDRELQKRQVGEGLIRQRAMQLQSLADVVSRVVAAKDIDSIIAIALNEFRQLIGAREALIQLRENGQVLVKREIIATGVQQPSEEYLNCIFELVGLLARGEAVFFRNRAQLVSNNEIASVRAWSVCRDAMDGVLTAPIRDGQGDEIGRIVLMGKFCDEFNTHDVTIVSQLAFTVSVAIENARLTSLARLEADRKDEFLAMLGHELRNPLAGILTGSEALLEIGNGVATRPLLESIHRQSVFMSKIIDDLLDVSRIARGKIHLSKSHFDVVETVENLITDFRQVHPKRLILLALPHPKSPILIHGDRTRIVQCITNLLQNACKFSDEYQPVEVAVSIQREQSTRVKIALTDYGIGLTSMEIDDIFQLFHQSNASFDRTQGGLGIGLTLAKGLIEMHGGTISATSRGRGFGAKFTISLPISDGEALHPKSPTDSISSRILANASNKISGSCRILVIDDRMDVILPIRVLLTQDGHQIDEALDGNTGLEKARQFRPDLILCDLGLPGEMNGFDVAKAIRQDPELKDTYLVALSGYSQPNDQQSSLQAGFDFHVAKPIEHRVLKQLVSLRPKFSKEVSDK